MKHILPLLLIGIVLLTSCASKRNYKKAQKFDEAGLYTDAAGLYYKSLKANKNNIDAKLGLQRTGQMVLEDKVEAFQNQYNNGTAKDAVYAYRAAETYYNKLSTLGVKLILAEEQKEYYLEVKDKYLDKLYQDATKALSLDEFTNAESLFSEILSLDKNFKDAQTHWITAKYEPIYRNGNQLIDNRSFRSAYGKFNLINKGTQGYKNSLELQNKCLQNATVSIAVLPFSYQRNYYQHYSATIKENVVSKISQIQSPFYKVISDQTINTVPNWSKLTNEETALKYAQQVDFEAKSILSARIDNYLRQEGELKRREKRGYLKKTIEVLNPETKLKETKVKYTKVRYYEYMQENRVILSLSYKLNRVDRNELALADKFQGEEKDRLYYARFDGDYNQLVAGSWQHIDKDTPEDQIYDSEESNNRLRSLFSNKKDIKSASKLESILLQKCGEHVSKKISQYQPEN